MKKRFVWGGLIFLALLVASTVLFRLFSPSAGPEPQEEGKAESELPTPVEVVSVKISPIEETLTLGGNLMARQTVGAYPEIAGKLQKLSVSVGDSVKKGQILATVDPSKPGTLFRKSPIHAPISGTVLETPIPIGTQVSSGKPIVKIGNLSSLQILINVPDRIIPHLKKGGQTLVSLPGINSSAKINARVDSISPIVDFSSRTAKVWLSLDNPEKELRAGMYAKVHLVLERRERALTVPNDAVVHKINPTRTILFVVDGDLVHEQEVSLGIVSETHTELLEASIVEGDLVVVRGQSFVKEGAKVTIIEKDGQPVQSPPENKEKESSPEDKPSS